MLGPEVLGLGLWCQQACPARAWLLCRAACPQPSPPAESHEHHSAAETIHVVTKAWIARFNGHKPMLGLRVKVNRPRTKCKRTFMKGSPSVLEMHRDVAGSLLTSKALWIKSTRQERA